ncbi:MAG: transglutaminase family protein [Cytophagales bacterium]|nr:transglutaminase family protein [Cytophagales bacterium]MDW8384569.1 transglutaminase family protein [Flammeovirgaceae bacterium]
MKYKVTHTTEYRYSEQVSLCHNIACLLPRSLSYQINHYSDLQIEPSAHLHAERTDFFGNRLFYFSIQQPHQKLRVTAVSEVELLPRPQTVAQDIPWEKVRDSMRLIGKSSESIEIRQFIFESPMVPITNDIREFAKITFTPQKGIFEACYEMMQRIFHEFSFVSGFTTIATPLSEVLKHRKGVCQDFAHLAIAAIRSVGLPARYVSGYIETIPPPGKEKLIGTDVSHAWYSVYIPNEGWMDFDPTNNMMPNLQHITIAWGRDYSDVTPLKGIIYGSGSHTLSVSVDVQKI